MNDRRTVCWKNATRIVAFAAMTATTSLFAGEIRGKVVDVVTGKPAADVLVSIQATKQSLRGGKGEAGLRETRTDANGQYVFSDLPALIYNVWASVSDRTGAALNSIPVAENESNVLDDLQLVEGSWIEGRIQTLRGEPVSRDPKTGERLQIVLSGPARPRSGSSVESTEVGDDGRFRLRVPSGRNFPRIVSTEVWEQTWRKEKYERGIDVESGQHLPVNFRILDRQPSRIPGKKLSERDPVVLPPPVAEEWDCAEAIRDLGGWYKLDAQRHVVEINMVYNDETGTRYDNRFTSSDEALRIAPAFPHLKTLYLHEGQATDESLACLANLTGLETFFIWNAIEVTDSGAKHLANLENITMIHISNSRAGDSILEAISRLPKLTQISMQKNSFTDAGLAHLAGMTQLRSLWIGMSKCEITDTGIAHLAGLENLEQLDLQHSKITDEGLESLVSMKKLRNVHLGRSKATGGGLAALRRALPNASVK